MSVEFSGTVDFPGNPVAYWRELFTSRTDEFCHDTASADVYSAPTGLTSPLSAAQSQNGLLIAVDDLNNSFHEHP